MKELNYKIEFFSEWHCGSGLSAGADIDSLVVKDPDGLPFIPGKTLKGLIREAFEDYVLFSGVSADTSALFGKPTDGEGLPSKGQLFFTNATIADDERQAILGNKVQDFLYQKRVRTAIDDKGIAQEHSLRSIETVVPCMLYAAIINVPEDAVGILTNSLALVKRMGVNRSRGLGRCQMSVVDDKKGGKQ